MCIHILTHHVLAVLVSISAVLIHIYFMFYESTVRALGVACPVPLHARCNVVRHLLWDE